MPGRKKIQPELALTLGLILSAIALGTASNARAQVSFDRDIAPILSANCIECHGGKSTKAGLNLTTLQQVKRGAKSGPILIAGKSSQSLIAQLIQADSDPHMPPKGQLSATEISLIKRWVDEMKEGPAVVATPGVAAKDHWAFKAPVRPALPGVKDARWPINPIDSFILAKLEAKGLSPSPAASREVLIRRATFDLIGLPPKPAEVAAFVADESPDAYERVLDRLLASPDYGQRWARHWLDLARYADSGGFHNDLDRPNAWRYRDYVIDSLNADKPYGQFVREQLAGDEVAPGSAEALAATGFCRNGPSNEDNVGREIEKYRMEELDDVISTTSSVFLGLTLGCARCHDHKFDPIPQADYYRFLAVFNSTVRKDVPLDEKGQPDWQTVLAKPATRPTSKPSKLALKTPAVIVVTEIGSKARTTNLLWRGDVNNIGPEVQPGVPIALTHRPVTFPAPAAHARTTGQRSTLAQWITADDNPLTWRVIANRLWQYHFGRGIVGTSSNFGITGDRPTHPELLDWLAVETVARGGSLKAMHKLIMMSATYRQGSLRNEAAATLDPENTLLWRMNKRRIEAEAVRDSILAVSGNLNPKMGGPGIKPRIPADMREASQRNKWPLVAKEGPEHWRRSVYIYLKRQLQFPMLELLDTPTSTNACARRSESIVPTQALMMMNDPFVNDQASYFADRLLREVPADELKRVDLAFRLALGHGPDARRGEDCVRFLGQRRDAYRAAGKSPEAAAREALADLCHTLLNCNEFVFID